MLTVIVLVHHGAHTDLGLVFDRLVVFVYNFFKGVAKYGFDVDFFSVRVVKVDAWPPESKINLTSLQQDA